MQSVGIVYDECIYKLYLGLKVTLEVTLETGLETACRDSRERRDN